MDRSFKKSERLKSKERISQLFKAGTSQKQGFLLIRFSPNEQSHFRIAFSVPKRKVPSAVKRNLIKRRLREVYRLHKADFQALWPEENQDVVMLYLASEVHSYAKIEANFQKLISRLHNPQ